MYVWIVFEYCDYGNQVVGVYKEEEAANKAHAESPICCFIEKHKVR